MPFKYIVEHMEPELDEWSELEYTNILTHVGPSNLILSHIPASLATSLQTHPTLNPESGIIATTKAVQEMDGVEFGKVVLLDPAATEELRPEDAREFGWLLFGGILGDDPPQDRTRLLRALGYTTRHLGPVQMTTDTAVLVAQHIIEDQIPLSELKFVDRPEIKLGKKESVELPFRYLVDAGGEPRLPRGLRELLKRSNDVALV
ncbi:SAM-dependent RNA methyltransferase [Fimicolochytrium jonesii]|uniref:SAM-dependent RNA methyltransferase n=1 Tax=Fimicolochytrium jonesii TaxID=1396493 RepID=UPI0022FEC598|nr:SAM-dependent RNA methyltransferase [Fimicolochytrium jonesii]KAI8817480.1 SAM-dependent RNA methyltransferase [Fimicolochytrium jonesii]